MRNLFLGTKKMTIIFIVTLVNLIHCSEGLKFSSVLHKIHNNMQGSSFTEKVDITMCDGQFSSDRRSVIENFCAIAVGTASFFPLAGIAAEENIAVVTRPTSTSSPSSVPMKTFVDPKGLFSIRVPQSFYTLRRTAKGDLPDAKTGKGRRGSSIFTSGDMAKAEIVAIERFPIKVLLEDEGIDSSGDLSNFEALGTPKAVAQLLNARREKDKEGQSKTMLVENSVTMSADKQTLFFELRTKVDVLKPDLLFEQTGQTELVRITLGRADITSGDDQMMVCYASALDSDFKGTDGDALREVIDSFIVKMPQVTDT